MSPPELLTAQPDPPSLQVTVSRKHRRAQSRLARNGPPTFAFWLKPGSEGAGASSSQPDAENEVTTEEKDNAVSTTEYYSSVPQLHDDQDAMDNIIGFLNLSLSRNIVLDVTVIFKTTIWNRPKTSFESLLINMF